MEKKELSEKLNQLLGLENNPVGFEKLSKEDLERLLQVFTNIAQIAQVGVRSMRSKVQQGILLAPAKEVLNMRVIDLIGSIRKEGGLVGILDALLQERRKPVGKE
jgi:hypothetical protein